MKVPGSRDRASSSHNATTNNVAPSELCPLPCWPYHIENIMRLSGTVPIASWCELCEQVVTTAEWREEFRHEREQK